MISVLPMGKARGAPVNLFALRNPNGVEVRVSNYGASIISIVVPDRNHQLDDVVLGFDSLAGYLAHTWYCGATVGRYAGRISNARFRLDGRDYELSANEGPHHLHGGVIGFDKVVWQARTLEAERGVRLRYISADGEEGYAGTLDTAVTYKLTDDNDLIVDYSAATDRPTPINLTQHSYFNLAGSSDILHHELSINADAFLPVNNTLIPTGGIRSVEGTPFDFRQPVRIGARIHAADQQLEIARGYDHDFVIRNGGPEHLGAPWAARAHEPGSGRVLEVFTTQPALHFYSGNSIASGPPGRNQTMYGAYSGFALETQHFADSPNQPPLPSTILRPGAPYRARTVYRFSIAAPS